MAEVASGASGLLDSVRRMGGSFLALIHTRAELFAVELQEQKLRAISLLGWLIAALALAVAGILLAIGMLGLFLWQLAGYAGLIGLVVATLGSSVGLLWMLRRRILSEPDPFASTLSEMAKDLECLESRQ